MVQRQKSMKYKGRTQTWELRTEGQANLIPGGEEDHNLIEEWGKECNYQTLQSTVNQDRSTKDSQPKTSQPGTGR